uniref:Cytochrome P450 n=1 Tax=Setaria italica TaxID=4555 RepID=K3ZDH4_SETIT
NLHHTLTRLAHTHGPIMCLQLSPVSTVAISWDAATEAFTRHDRRLTRCYTINAVLVLGWAVRSLINMASSDPLWKLQRGILAAHVFSPWSLAAVRSVRERKVRDLVTHLRARTEREVDVGRALYSGMINLVLSTFFSIDMVDVDATGESAHGIREHMENIGDLMTKPNGQHRAVAWHLREIYRIMDGIIERRLAKNADGRHGDDFLQVLLDLMSMGKIDRDTVKAIVFEVFFTGGDTITITVEWAMAELLHNPSAMARLRAEIAGALGGKETIEETDVACLSYLQTVFKESMRLYPVAPLLVPHKAVEDGVEVCGYAVPKGCTVVVNVWVFMRDTAVWDEPDRFMPERFLGKAAEVDYMGKEFEFFPFGYGRRQCPGMPMAERIVPHLLASLLHVFKWRLPEGMAAEQLDVSERFKTGNVPAIT